MTVNPIHPESGRLYAESPFQRKIIRIIEDLSTARSIGNEQQRDTIAWCIAELSIMIGRKD